MKKILNKNYIMLLIVALFVSFVVGYITTPYREYYEESDAPAVDENYDKMKISYLKIKERKTGTPYFDNESNMEGNDASDEDNYLRTLDIMSYILEVGIDRNEATTSATDNFTGGKIKLKITIPKDENGVPYLAIMPDAWMKGRSYNSDLSTFTAYYEIPSGKSAIGGNQQLSVTIKANSLKHTIDSQYMPKFEVWMEGNKPDNANSVIESKVVQDEGPLYITGKPYASISLTKGSVNTTGTLDGVNGQYLNFGARLVGSSNIGRETPMNYMKTKIKIEYSYKDIEHGTNWINIATIDENNPVYNTILYAYGLACESTPGFYPNEDSNSGYSYCANNDGYYSVSTTAAYSYIRNSGTVTATQSTQKNEITLENNDFYYYGNYDLVAVSDGLELFVPWYEPEDGSGRYQYQVIITAQGVDTEDSEGNEVKSTSTSSITYTYYNYMTGNFNNDIYMGSYYMYTDTHLIPLDEYTYTDSYVVGTDGPYEGGLEKLEVWNSSIVNLYRTSSSPSIHYSGGDSSSYPKNSVLYYGIYKADKEHGVTTDELVNAATFDDFDWYTNYNDAISNGKVTALRTDEPEWRGFNVKSYIYDVYLRPPNDPSLIGKKGIIRQKIWIYSDAERTDVYEIGTDVDYVSSIMKSDYSGLEREAAPRGIGETYYVGTNMSIYVGSSAGKSSYNVEEELVNMTISPSYSNPTQGLDFADFKIQVSVPTYLKYKLNSSNYEPVSVVEKSNGTSVITWEFNNWSLVDDLPKITYQLEISPYAPNNTSKYVSTSISCSEVKTGSYSTGSSFYIINLAGSSIRKIIDKQFLDREEQTTINNYIYNIAQSRLLNVKTVEILPKNGDSVGSSYSGSYTLQVESLLENQKFYYTTNNIDNIGLVEDAFGKKHIQSVDLDDSSNGYGWTEVHVGDIIPENATAIASMIPEVSAATDVVYKLKFIPVGNTYEDKYFFKLTASSDNLETAIATEYKKIVVADRKISGIVFLDKNRNNVYDSGVDTLQKNKTVKIYKADGTLDREVTTNNAGEYESYHFDKGEYYISYDLSESGNDLYFVNKNGGSLYTSSIINPNTGRSDIIQELNQLPTMAIMSAENKNIGIKYKDAQVIVHHYIEDTETRVYDDVIIDTSYNSTYTTSPIDSYYLYEDYQYKYEFSEATGGDLVSDTVTKDLYEVIYYYTRIQGVVYTQHRLIPNEVYDYYRNARSVVDVQYVYYGDSYTTSPIDDPLYTFEYASSNATGTVWSSTTWVYYYYSEKPTTITVHHYIDGTTTPVHEDQSIRSYYMYNYITSPFKPDELDEEYRGLYSYNYLTEGDPVSGIVSKDNYEITYYYSRRPVTLKVHHYLEGTMEKISGDVISSVYYGEQYTTSRLDNSSYLPAGEGGDLTSGIASKETIEVIYYYKIKPATVTVHHYIDGTTTKVHEDDILNRDYKEVYNTSPYETEELLDDYKNIYKYADKHEGSTKGIVSEDSAEVIYYYDKLDAKIVVHHYVLGTIFKVHGNEVFDKKINDPYETHHKESNELVDHDYVYDSVVGDEVGSMTTDRVVVTYYYKLKEGNIVVHHITDDTNEELCPDETASGTYKTKYNYDSCTTLSNINYTFKEVKGNDSNSEVDNDKISGRIEKDNTEITYYYTYKPGQIVGHYFLVGTRERVADDVIANGKLNQEYTSSAKELEGYKLVKEPEVNTITFKEDTQELVYEYERLKYKIEVEVVAGEGTITGAEEVFYGDNEKSNVVITPGEEYEVNSVKVNGKELNTLNIEGMTLNKFENIKENIKVEVSFTHKSQDIPITGKTRNTLLYVGSILFILAFSIFIIFDLKKSNNKF